MNIKPLNESGLLARWLNWLARQVIRYRRWLVAPQVCLFVLCVLYTVRHLEFDNKRSSLVGRDQRYHRLYQEFKEEFPTQDDLVVVVESEEAEKNRQFVERLGAKLERETNTFNHVLYKGDLKMLGAKALLFVPEGDLAQLKATLHDYRPFIQKFSQSTNLVSLFQMLNTQFRTARKQEQSESESLVKALPALERIVRQTTSSLRRSGTPPSPGITALFNPERGAEQKLYLTSADGRIYLVTVQAPRAELNDRAIQRLRELVQETRMEVPGLNVGLTGEPVLELDEMNQSRRDTTVASLVALILCAFIFIYGYQETGRPIKATLCLILGLGYTMGFTTLVIGHLNILTITFVPILIGLAIDYGVHLISRYEEELRHGKSEEAALTRAMVYTGQGIFTGAFTTAGAFLAMALTNFRGIQEMGIICGGGLLICLVPMMTVLPALLLRGRQNVMDHEAGSRLDHRARIENLWLQRPVAVVVITLALCALSASQLRKVTFDYNLLHMQSKGLAAVQFEHKLIESSSKSVLYAAVVTTNLQQALALEHQITNLTSVASVNSITQFLAEDQRRKLETVSELKRDLASLEFAPLDPRPVNVPELSATLYSFYGYLGAAREVVQTNDPPLADQLFSLREAVGELRKEMQPGETNAVIEARLSEFQRALFRDLHDTFAALKHQDDTGPLRIEDLPPVLRDRFIGVTGKYLIMVYPRHDVWQREHQQEFIRQLQTLDPEVTGTPVQLYYYTELLKTSYEDAARYALLAIALLVFFHFRSPLSVALALTPVIVGFLWLGGIMGYFGIPLNPANIMMLPLVIGIGVTNGIQVLNRYAEEQHPAMLARSTGKAVLVSGLTSIAGFGSLILAQHRGIQSLGQVMAIGLSTCMIAGLTFLPALLNLLGHIRVPQHVKRPSADNARSALGREEPR